MSSDPDKQKGGDGLTANGAMMKRVTQRSLTLSLSRAASTALVSALGTAHYGSTSTPGPRQTAILAQIADCKATKGGRRALTVAEVSEIQCIPRSNAETALAGLRLRGLVSVRGTRFGLTARGVAAAALFSGLSAPVGVGFVLTGHPIRSARH